MGLNNFLMTKVMKGEAKNTALWARKRHDSVKEQYPNLSGSDLYQRMLCDPSELRQKSAKYQKIVADCCQSINGLCYMMAMDLGAMKNTPVFRCLQFTKYLDEELRLRGFPAPSMENKKRALGALDLLVDGWEQYI